MTAAAAAAAAAAAVAVVVAAVAAAAAGLTEVPVAAAVAGEHRQHWGHIVGGGEGGASCHSSGQKSASAWLLFGPEIQNTEHHTHCNLPSK